MNRFVAYSDFEVKEGNTIISMHPFHEDALIVVKKES